MTAKIGLFYGSSTCYTEMAGEKICEQINSNFKNNVVSLHNIADVPVSQMADFDYLILGIPTWSRGLRPRRSDWLSRMVSGCPRLSVGQGQKSGSQHGW